MTTNYGTIPTSSSSSHHQDEVGPSRYFSRAKQRLKEGFGKRKPWKEMFNFRSFGLPSSSFRDSMSGIKTNLAYFQMNYVIVVLLIIFFSLLWHPISLIVFLVMMVVWLFLYFLRDEPLSVFGRQIGDIWVMIVLAVLTLVFLLLTHVTENVLISLLIGVVLVVIHGVFRKTDDLFTDEEEEAAAAAGTADHFLARTSEN
ncbi:PRA1 family protein F3-like [Impatiens glandulifera]|uniref:PRA1 family protein F3-like n=1 Tax=Impatiens glandulifera TaxID=253017 RepID=UPI001FB15839|nr:PRA1 family protein F3-like [Impatiens glandulifera]